MVAKYSRQYSFLDKKLVNIGVAAVDVVVFPLINFVAVVWYYDAWIILIQMV